MRKRSGTKNDINQLVRSIVDLVTGNPIAEDISPIAEKAKDPAVVALGRLGRPEGGKLRAEKPSAEPKARREK